jgi:hypothetical protein
VKPDDIEGILRDTLRSEVAAAGRHLNGLEERIVSELGDRLPRLRFVDWLSGLIAPTRVGRVGQLAVLGATAAVFLVVGVLITQNRPLGQALEPSLASRASQETYFVVPALDKESVAVVGDFNAWEAMPLTDDNSDGIWTVAIPLPPGRYEYAFIIDGQWWGQDPLADEYVRTFGQYSSVRYVGQGGNDS